MRRLFILSTSTTIVLLSALLGIQLTEANANTLWPEAKIVHVVDGDTVVVIVAGKKEHLRLIGIDTPESRPNRRADLQADRNHTDRATIIKLGNEASNYARTLMPKGSTIQVEYDVERRDRYNRLLGYLWSKSGKMINEEILRAGYAYPLPVAPNLKYRGRLSAAFADSRSNKRGLWGTRR
jgi:micrococcal nuclease